MSNSRHDLEPAVVAGVLSDQGALALLRQKRSGRTVVPPVLLGERAHQWTWDGSVPAPTPRPRLTTSKLPLDAQHLDEVKALTEAARRSRLKWVSRSRGK
jgi:hypothetical protein